jgi:hypothetical protein
MTPTMSQTAIVHASGLSGIARSLAAFESARTTTMNLASRLTEEQAAFSPGGKSWSIAQNLDHIAKIEGVYRTQIARLIDLAREGKKEVLVLSLGDGDPRPPFVPATVMPLLAVPLTFINLFVPSVVRETIIQFPVVKASSPKNAEPTPGIKLGGAIANLREATEITRRLLGNHLPSNAQKVFLIHPIFGRNGISDILRLMTAHEQRHGQQMQALLRHPGYPTEK